MRWLRQLPPRPVVPSLLGLTGAGCVLAVLSLVFGAELWPHHPAAAGWGRAVLAGLLLAAAAQSIRVLWGWPAPYHGPAGLRLLLHAAALALSIGIAILMVPLLALTVVFISKL